MVIGAQHDRIGIARQHPRGIRHGFAAPELGGASVEHDRGAAELADRHIEAHPRARGVFLEHHRQRVPGERRIGIGPALGPAGPRRLAVKRIGQHRGDAIRPGVRQIEEVTHRRGQAAAAGT